MSSACKALLVFNLVRFPGQDRLLAYPTRDLFYLLIRYKFSLAYLNFNSLQEEIKKDLNFYAVQIKIHPRRLKKAMNFNYDIGLMKLDRPVLLGPDIAPICMDGFLPQFKPTTDAAYISGFGLTIFKRLKKTKKPECSTNEFLPRPFHTCEVRLFSQIHDCS